MPQLTINGLRLHYVEEGRGPAVVLLHELGGSTCTWVDLQKSLAAAGFRTVALDLRGAGQSEVPATGYSLADLASDILAAMDCLNIAATFLVGLAVGGFVALQVAVTASNRVLGLVLLDAVLSIPKAAAEHTRQRTAVVLREGMAAVADLSISRSFPPPVARVCPTEVSAYRARFLKNDPRGYALASLAALEADFRAVANSIDVPALVLVGEHDLLFPPEQARALARALPQATCAVIPGAGHFPPLQTPAAVLGSVLSFLHQCVGSGLEIQ